MAYPVFRSVSALSWTTVFGGNVLDVIIPSDTQPGDLVLIIAQGTYPNTTGISGFDVNQTMTITGAGPSSSWAMKTITLDNTYHHGFVIGSKTATKDMAGQRVTVTLYDNVVTSWGVYAVVFSNASELDTNVAISGMTTIYPAVNTTVNETLVLRLHVSCSNGSATIAPIMPATSRLSAAGPAVGTVATYGVQVGMSSANGPATPGSTGTLTGTTSAWGAATIVIKPYVAPRAPVLVEPLEGQYADISGYGYFRWQNNPVGPGMQQESWYLRRKAGVGGTYYYYNYDSDTWQLAEYRNYYTDNWFAIYDWVNNTQYFWSVKLVDQNGLTSPYSEERVVNVEASPLTGTITLTPTNTRQFTVSWSPTFYGGSTQKAVRFKIYKLADCYRGTTEFDFKNGVCIYDSDVQRLTAASVVFNSVANPAWAVDLENNQSYRLYLQVRSSHFTWSGGDTGNWVDFTTDFVGLSKPSVSAAAVTSPVPGIQLTLATTGNVLDPVASTFETPSGTGNGWSQQTNCTVVATPNAPSSVYGKRTITQTSSAAGNMIMRTGNYYPVKPSTSYTGRFNARALSSVTRSVRMSIAWFTSAQTPITSNQGSNITDVQNSWTEGTVTATSPSNAAYAQLVIEVVSCAGASEQHYFDAMSLEEGGTKLTLPLGKDYSPTTPLLRYKVQYSDTSLPFENLLSESDQDFEYSLGAWSSFGTNWSTAVKDTMQYYTGTASMKCVRANTTAGNGQVATYYAKYPVMAGEPYQLSMYVYADGTSGGKVYTAKITWYSDYSDTVISSSTQNLTLTAYQWNRIQLSATAPTGAVVCKVFLTDEQQASPASGQTVWLDHVELFPRPWADLPGFQEIVPSATLGAVLNDYLVPDGVTRYYRVRSTVSTYHPDAGTYDVTSVLSTVASATAPSRTKTYLVDAQYPSNAVRIIVNANDTVSRPRGQGVVTGLGLANLQIFDDVVQLRGGETTIAIQTIAEQQSVLSLLNSGHVLAVQPRPEDGVTVPTMYFKVLGDVIVSKAVPDELLGWRYIKFSWLEQNAPQLDEVSG